MPVYSINGKLWGKTQSLCLSKDYPIHVAVAHLKKGGYSSRHYHEKIWNRFHVISGSLNIISYKNNQEESVIIGPGHTLDCEPKLEHRMVALEDSVIIEMYWPEDLNSDFKWEDIVRFDDGGRYYPNENFTDWQ